MADYEINGRIISFPGITYQALKTYQPTPRTWILAWKAHEESCVNLAVNMLLHTMYTISAIERPPHIIDDTNGKLIYLLEHPNENCLEHITTWLRWTCGTNYYCKCPYREQLSSEIATIERETEDEIWKYQHRLQLSKLKQEDWLNQNRRDL